MNQMTPAANPGLTRCRAVALLVDGENLSPDYAGQMITTTGREIGRIAVQRVYGDVTRLNGWLSAPGFRAMHAHAGKNVTDMLMTVEAMELSFGGQIDGFAIATRDRDFAPLAWSLRARGFPVLGLLPGDAAPDHLRKSFDRCAPLLPVARLLTPVAPPSDGVAVPSAPNSAAPRNVSKAPADSAAKPLDAALIHVIRRILAPGPMTTAAFGNALRDAGYSGLKGTNSWQAWSDRHPGHVSVSGTGHATMIALKP